MKGSMKGSDRQQRVGGFAAIYLAVAYIIAMPYFLFLVKYADATNAADKVALLVGNRDSMTAVYLITYVILGIVLAVLALALHDRLKVGAPVLAQASTVVGVMWGFVLVASGMVFNAGMATVVELNATNPTQAVSVWQAIEPVANGLGGAGGELLGGLWVLLVSAAALRTGMLPKALNWLGVAIGVAGIASVVPVARELQYAFGAFQIVWFAWLGVAMLRGASRAADPGIAG